MTEQRTIAEKLTHVLWIGGTPGAGKSSICQFISRIYVFLDYRVDPRQRDHSARRLAQKDEQHRRWLQKNMKQRWLETPTDVLAQDFIQAGQDLSLVLEDLLAMPTEPMIVAEGNFMPEAVLPYLSSPQQAIWLVPTKAFNEYARRTRFEEQKKRFHAISTYPAPEDPERHLRALVERDALITCHVKAQAQRLQLPCYEIDGSRSLAEMTELVEQHFYPYIVEHMSKLKPL
ncbi:hypothetical protein EI42_02713 [Thermosporothrix hazakensis]|uniref:AAA domain-containing protein n=1 Tax=Thermosporothrix hazakensis TaxID=644383 RepID=A0A326U810_THEHA|nr:hypothetical protein [Thermosporothrix hazakensis]PZW29419.1 hypothetical protein EI42_02713 [Thermosporothrix hazakensis]GCE45865.1 hypothetical protein KTH_07340 [Thermosporothrix hazakensis]